MICVRHGYPVDYSLCDQTVTIYHKDGDTYTRRVIEKGAFLEYKKTLNVEKTGNREANSFLLVVPGGAQAVFAGDKVLHGAGPEVATAEQWRRFIPANVPGLCVVQFVDVKHWNGKIIHTEAGG